MGIQSGSQHPYSVRVCHAFLLSETLDPGGFPVLLLLKKHESYNRQNFYSNHFLKKKSQWDIIGKNSVISENISSNCLTLNHLHCSQTTNSFISLFEWHHSSTFQLDLGTCHCSEFSDFSTGRIICLFSILLFCFNFPYISE